MEPRFQEGVLQRRVTPDTSSLITKHGMQMPNTVGFRYIADKALGEKEKPSKPYEIYEVKGDKIILSHSDFNFKIASTVVELSPNIEIERPESGHATCAWRPYKIKTNTLQDRIGMLPRSSMSFDFPPDSVQLMEIQSRSW
ncbi:CIC11C00000001717 [Sungouiella intermedia]|uniref:CIC11C00000001717 n=1 Tax=Sungouiella intermedia TaxID=45354 RepID=A0A1L0BNJ5_9ASCO|nr:CIC11C00000001717 [[Candida] intermedia]